MIKGRDIWYTLALLVVIGLAAMVIVSFTDLSLQEQIVIQDVSQVSPKTEPAIAKSVSRDMLKAAFDQEDTKYWDSRNIIAGKIIFTYLDAPEGYRRDCLIKAEDVYQDVWDHPDQLETKYKAVFMANSILKECLENLP